MIPDKVDNDTHPVSQGFGQPAVDYYGGSVWVHPSACNGSCYFMFTQRYHHWMGHDQGYNGLAYGPGTIDVGLAVSRDGKTFVHLDNTRAPFIALGQEGGWESRRVWALPSPIVMRDGIYGYYAGTNTNDLSTTDSSAPAADAQGVNESDCIRVGQNPPGACQLSGIGLARARLDGFTALVSPTGEGIGNTTLVTVPLLFNGSQLRLNSECDPGGVLRVAILNASSGLPLQGEQTRPPCTLKDIHNATCDGSYNVIYDLASSVPVIRNSIANTARWKNGGWIVDGVSAISPAIQAMPVRLQFVMRGCRLYAFQFV